MSKKGTKLDPEIEEDVATEILKKHKRFTISKTM
jgi:hypothetical protein